ncbi:MULTISPECIES: helix-turn-helix domain-containing protein [Vibrio]|uniref:Helix-turn-helix transcriptional regulator n=1 Tax=Vibrio qingdaonensis TaxID=2829491 RepID=A0A9X3HX29_9VIBR|nr:helix-turn-helix transcriptional regulator [Vibrio qingdaonensis]MCW8346823.1 helix-turn-helix transcriptional regulator [Vibrio qingdaonensis]
MNEFDTRGFEFFGDSEKWFRKQLIERLEVLLAHQSLSKNQLAKLAGLPKTSLYQKMDKNEQSYFTIIELFRIAKSFDISIVQLLPIDDVDRKHPNLVPLPASSLKFLDEMLAAEPSDIELLNKLYKTIKQHRLEAET